eukprot:7251335-Lingulodinium_polyedra.AAC.1
MARRPKELGVDESSAMPRDEGAQVREVAVAVSADAIAERLSQSGQRDSLLRTAQAKIMSGKFEVVFIEICCEQDSKLVEFVPRKALAIRVTEDDELCKKGTIRALRGII